MSQHPTMSRRTFLRLTIAGVTVLGAGALMYQEAYGNVQLITGIVREKLSYLTLDEAGLEQFAHDYMERAGISRYGTVIRGLQGDEREQHFLATLYLMSSDFFWRDADTTRVVQYRALHNVHIGCSNPFAQLT